MAKSNKANKGATVEGGKAQPQIQTIDLSALDESALLEALAAKREARKASIVSEIQALEAQIVERTADLRQQVEAKRSELRSLGVSSGGRSAGGSINPKGETARAILLAMRENGRMTPKALKDVPAVAAVMVGKYEKSFLAVALAALRSKGLVESPERGVWQLTEAGGKAANEAAAEGTKAAA